MAFSIAGILPQTAAMPEANRVCGKVGYAGYAVPGHSAALLAQYPRFACDPSNTGREFCLGNPDGRNFVKSILAEVMDIFKDSQ